MNNLTWSDVYQRRFDWAKTAHSKFMQKFDPNLYHTEDIKDQVYIIVYGASQVGKTSLILELIGVIPEYYNTVQKVLRGDRSFGRSATSTVVRYYTSSDKYWYISNNYILVILKSIFNITFGYTYTNLTNLIFTAKRLHICSYACQLFSSLLIR